ncbi:EF-hand domain-containing protein [Sphingomonas bacterium]|uniref:EF-hand domain-containing protein n=1 Tax=Sphingomonas bacterium TaxID=1895847 RepID=UPI001575F319|nr:EF-hand domain-containing protein [Sphingomonas bacterium]
MIRLTLAAALAGIAVPAAAQDTRASAAAKYDLEFAATDTNHDGVLTRAEVQARIGRMQASGNRIDPVHAKRLADLWFDHADANKDGKVTRAEGQTLLAKTFDLYDRNHDGKIDADERAAAGAAKGR